MASKVKTFAIATALVVLPIVVVQTCSTYRTKQLLSKNGVATKGVATAVISKNNKELIRYKFEVNGQVFEGKEFINTGLQKGDSLEIYYLPDNPSTNRVAQ